PAFRFLLQRHRTNLRKLRLRHIVLLALRILLIAAVVFAVARPMAVLEFLQTGKEGPVAAVLVFDTSFSMQYKKDGQTRLDEAKKRGKELVEKLPPNSWVLVLDTGKSHKPEKWFSSKADALRRIDDLQPRPDNVPVTTRLGEAYRRLGDQAPSPEQRAKDLPPKNLPRTVCVFSDRTTAGWDSGAIQAAHAEADRVPPPSGKLPELHEKIGPMTETLKALRERLSPASGQEYPDQ